MPDALLHHQYAKRHVANQPACAGVTERPAIGKFLNLADIVEEHSGEKEVPAELGVMLEELQRKTRHGEGMFEKPSEIGMMIQHCRRGYAKSGAELLVREEGVQERPEVRILHSLEDIAEFLHHLARVILALGKKIAEPQPFRIRSSDSADNYLELVLICLHLALYVDEVVNRDGAGKGFGGVPQAAGDLTGAVAELEGQIGAPCACGAKNRLGYQEDRVDRFARPQVANHLLGHLLPLHGKRSAGYSTSSRPGRSFPNCSDRRSKRLS